LVPESVPESVPEFPVARDINPAFASSYEFVNTKRRSRV
jgi:hypothetical protein